MEKAIFTNVNNVQKGAFLDKVFFFFGLAILLSFSGVYLGTGYIMGLIIEHPSLIWVLFGAELGLVFTSRFWSTKQPINYILFSLFAFITGITIVPLIQMFVIEFGGYAIIQKALMATTLTFTASAIIGRTTKKNLLGLSGFLFMGLIGMIIIGIIGMFFPWSNTFEMIYAGFGVVLFNLFVIIDVQRLKHYPEDRYIDAAIALYLDIFNLFIFVLRLMASLGRD